MSQMTYTQTSAGAMLGVTRVTVARLIRNGLLATTPDGKITVWALADYLGTTPSELLGLQAMIESPDLRSAQETVLELRRVQALLESREGGADSDA